MLKKIWLHFKLITKHKWIVFKFCSKVGMPWRGLIHDLSKYSPTEFWESAKYYVGYNVFLDGKYYYIMGDTDKTDEALQVKADICFVPIGGTYTMDYQEAADYINEVKPSVAIPIHYGMITGDIDLGEKFKEKVDKDIEVDILIGG